MSLSAKPKTITFLEENIGENLHEFCLGKYFLDTTPKSWFIKEETDTVDFIDIWNFCYLKEWKDKSQSRKTYLQIIYMIKYFNPEYIKNMQMQ